MKLIVCILLCGMNVACAMTTKYRYSREELLRYSDIKSLSADKPQMKLRDGTSIPMIDFKSALIKLHELQQANPAEFIHAVRHAYYEGYQLFTSTINVLTEHELVRGPLYQMSDVDRAIISTIVTRDGKIIWPANLKITTK